MLYVLSIMRIYFLCACDKFKVQGCKGEYFHNIAVDEVIFSYQFSRLLGCFSESLYYVVVIEVFFCFHALFI